MSIYISLSLYIYIYIYNVNSSERRSVVERGARKGCADEHHHAAGCREQSYKFRKCSWSTLCDGNRRYGGQYVPSTVLLKIEGRQEMGWPRETQKS